MADTPETDAVAEQCQRQINIPTNPVPAEFACHEKGWENKWKCAVEMAARAQLERDAAVRVLRVLKSDIDHIGHWIPDPCREMVESFLSVNASAMSSADPETPNP